MYFNSYKALTFALLSSFCLSIAFTFAHASCDLNSFNDEDCEALLLQGSSGFERIIHQFSGHHSVKKESTSQEDIAALFFKGASYFGLYQAERSPTLKCEYATRAMDALKSFSESAVTRIKTSNDEKMQSWLMRQMIYTSELSRIRNCYFDGISQAKVHTLINRFISETLEKFLSSPSERNTTFEPVYTATKNIISLTSDILTKIRLFKIELQGIDHQISRRDHDLGSTTKKLEEFGLSSALPIQDLSNRHARWKLSIEQLPNVQKSVESKADILERNNQSARELLRKSKLAKDYLDSLFVTNVNYQALKSQWLEQNRANLISLQMMGTQRQSINENIKKRLGQVCTGITSNYFFCH
jgi:hypothetical protein